MKVLRKRNIEINLHNTHQDMGILLEIWKCKQKKNGSAHLPQFPDVGHPLQRVAAQHHWTFIVQLTNNTIIIYSSTKKFNTKTNSNTNMKTLNNVNFIINEKNPLHYQNEFVIMYVHRIIHLLIARRRLTCASFTWKS